MAESGVAPGTASPVPEDSRDHTVVSMVGNHVPHVFMRSQYSQNLPGFGCFTPPGYTVKMNLCQS